MREWWFSTKLATGYVQTDDNNIITKTAPIWRRFTGQHIKNLADWLKKKGEKDFLYEELKSTR